MEKNNILILVIVGIVVVILIVFLIWRNHKDKREFNPDSQSSLEEVHWEQENKADSM